MKNKYQRMNNEEKEKIQKEYLKSKKGKNQSFYLKRLTITGTICIIFSFVILIINLKTNSKWYDYLPVGTLIVAGLIFIYTSNKIKIKELNKIAIKKK